MKTRECGKVSKDCPMYRLGKHWNTMQAYLIPGIKDDIGELGEDLKRFTQICELLINDAMFAKYRWCGNGRPPHSRVSLFKAYILMAMRNYPYTTTLIAAIRESPAVHRSTISTTWPMRRTTRRASGRCPNGSDTRPSSTIFPSASLSHSGKRLRWIVCQWRPRRYFSSFSDFSRMFYPFKPH